jgi:hypothetical protein
LTRKSLMRRLLVGLAGLSILAASCGGEGPTGGSQEDSENKQPSAMSETTMAKKENAEETTVARKTGLRACADRLATFQFVASPSD